MAIEWNKRQLFITLAIVLIMIAGVIARAKLSVNAGPAVEILAAGGKTYSVSLRQIKKMPAFERRGCYQNQLGNWRDDGVYTGVLLTGLLDSYAGKGKYREVQVEAADGYQLTIDQERLFDPKFPVVLAYAFNGKEVPEWTDGYRIAVLPVSGRVSNADYRAPTAGGYWVKNVIRLRAVGKP